jgi:hypothetical protein
MEENENRTSRGRFLKQLGLTLGAAVGVGALAAPAFANPGTCCYDTTCGSCGSEGWFWCRCQCFDYNYCWTSEHACRGSFQCFSCPC